ncbi:MAG: oxidoreductase [Actinobacteria bacterium]|nr:oxidoreductase [Actinomycetota bacterium]
MARYGMVIDVKKCVGCYNCFLTCRDEFAGNDYPGYSAAQPMSGMNWTKLVEIERGQYPHVKVAYVPVLCNQCDAPSCLKLDQTGAVYQRPDGIVMIDQQKAKGNKELVNLCPHRQIEWNDEQQVAQKCTMCAHLLDQGDPEPRCVESCPSGARVFGDLDDPNSEVAKLVALGATELTHPEYGLREKVMYLNLPRKFVAGTVIYGDIDEVAAGIEVSLSGEAGTETTTTNGFGDFEFDGLPENTKCMVKIATPGYQSATE